MGVELRWRLAAHAQDVKLFSADGTVCLIPQGDGNLVTILMRTRFCLPAPLLLMAGWLPIKQYHMPCAHM